MQPEIGSGITLQIGGPGGPAGMAITKTSPNGTTLADLLLQTELHTAPFRNEGRAASCATGAAPEFQVRFPPPFGTSPLAVARTSSSRTHRTG